MKLEMSVADAKTYSALYVAARDLGAAAGYANYIRKKEWHGWPILRRGSVGVQQQAFTDALVLAYGRVWSPPILSDFTWKSLSDANQHARLLDARNKIVGHSAPTKYSVRPWVTREFSTHIFGAPHLHFPKRDLERVIKMISVLSVEIGRRRLQMMTRYVGPEMAAKIART